MVINQYEISNFSKPGYESRHNLTYWNNEEYYGFGAGAHSYVNGIRIANIGPLKKYMEPIEQGEFPYMDEHHVTKRGTNGRGNVSWSYEKQKESQLRHFNEKFDAELD